MDFFDDEATGPIDAPPPPRRRSSNRRRNRILRLALGIAVVFVVLVLLIFWGRSCQHNKKVDSYRSYMDAVATAIDDSNSLGKSLKKIVDDPTKYDNTELKTQLQGLVTQQDEIATRVDRLDHPGTLDDEAAVLTAAMEVRARGFELFRKAITVTLGGKKQVKASSIAALEGYLTGPDAYYQSRFYMQARNAMKDDGVDGVNVPTSTWYLTSDLLDKDSVQLMLDRLQTSSKTAGIHGVSLSGVTVQPSGTELVRDKSVPVQASPDLSFNVTVENQGNVDEQNVPVAVTLQLPGGDKLTQNASIAAIAAGQKQTVEVSGFNIPTDALSKTSILTVKAGPVPQEKVLENNSATYKFLLQLK